jgi:hypothetical protein
VQVRKQPLHLSFRESCLFRYTSAVSPDLAKGVKVQSVTNAEECFLA